MFCVIVLLLCLANAVSTLLRKRDLVAFLWLVLVPRGGSSMSPRIHHHSADYIKFTLGSLGPLWYI